MAEYLDVWEEEEENILEYDYCSVKHHILHQNSPEKYVVVDNGCPECRRREKRARLIEEAEKIMASPVPDERQWPEYEVFKLLQRVYPGKPCYELPDGQYVVFDRFLRCASTCPGKERCRYPDTLTETCQERTYRDWDRDRMKEIPHVGLQQMFPKRWKEYAERAEAEHILCFRRKDNEYLDKILEKRQ